MATLPRPNSRPSTGPLPGQNDLARSFSANGLPADQAVYDPSPYTEAAFEPEPKQSISDFVTDRPALKWAIVALLAVALLFSELGLRPKYEQPESWSSTVQVIDEKKANVLALTTAAITLSAGISAIPDDTGTPIAEQLSQLASNLGIVLAVLYLEKYLLTILSLLSLGILIPISCLLFIGALLMHNRFSTSRFLRIAGTRIFVVAAIALAVVPASVWVTERIDQTYETSVETQAAASADDSKTDEADRSAQSGGNLIDSLVNAATNLGNTVLNGLQSVTDGVITKVNNLIEGAVVMIVTSCVIPLLVLAVFLWLGHTLLGIDVSGPAEALSRRLSRPAHKPAIGTGPGTREKSGGRELTRAE